MVVRLIASVLIVTVVAACTMTPVGDLVPEALQGSGKELRESREVDSFTEVAVADAIDAEITVGDEQSVTVVSDDNIVPLVRTIVEQGRLVVELAADAPPLQPEIGLGVVITVERLERLHASGASRAEASGVESKRFEIVASGASRITMDGEATDLIVGASGASRVVAAELMAQVADVDVSGASDVRINADDAVDVQASGASKVCYEGSPEVSSQLSGASSVEECP